MRLTKTRSGGEGLWFWCSGCQIHHRFTTRLGAGEVGPVWSFNGDLDRPTFSPSLLCNATHADPERGVHRCHLFLRDGVVEYLADCTHRLAGQRVPVEPSRF